jgi:uncharacterized protein DUF1348
MEAARPPLPPFDFVTATRKVRLAEDVWNTRDPSLVSLAYTVASEWRDRGEFLEGRDAIVAFLQRKWIRELDYRLIGPPAGEHQRRADQGSRPEIPLAARTEAPRPSLRIGSRRLARENRSQLWVGGSTRTSVKVALPQ